MKQYMLAVIHDWDNNTLTDDEMQQSFKDVDAFNKEITEKGIWVFGGGLEHPNTATVVDGTGAETLMTDGPYLETKEQLGGFWVIRAEDLDAARAGDTRIDGLPQSGGGPAFPG